VGQGEEEEEEEVLLLLLVRVVILMKREVQWEKEPRKVRCCVSSSYGNAPKVVSMPCWYDCWSWWSWWSWCFQVVVLVLRQMLSRV
jgi:hypothetical protein